MSTVTVETAASNPLFMPVTLGDLTLPNRIVMAPLTRNRAGPNNVPQPMNATYYAQRASAGLIISEATQVSPQGVGYPATPGIHSPEQVEGWRQVTEAVHRAGGRIFAQLWHVGRISHPDLQPGGGLPVAPSAIRPEGQASTYEGPKPFVTPRALDASELPQIVEQYAIGASNARRAGFDGVEIHAANGYLLDQFLRDGTNRRDDAYGGSIENRMRLLREVLAAVKRSWDPTRIGVRFSPVGTFNDMRDSDPQPLYNALSEQLSEDQVGYLHVVEDIPVVGSFDYRALRQRFAGLYMANSNYDRAKAIDALQHDRADLIAFGRPYIANPDLPKRLAADALLNAPDPETFYGGDERGYLDYPTMDQ